MLMLECSSKTKQQPLKKDAYFQDVQPLKKFSEARMLLKKNTNHKYGQKILNVRKNLSFALNKMQKSEPHPQAVSSLLDPHSEK